MFESFYKCINIFYMVIKINCEIYMWIVNIIEFFLINFFLELKIIVYICLYFFIDDMIWKIRCDMEFFYDKWII